MSEEGFDKNDEMASEQSRDEVYSKVVRAGKRTYFLDVKATKRNDYYVTITESKKRAGRDGKIFFEKHKLFLYKEDFDKFAEGLTEVIEFIREANPQETEPERYYEEKRAFEYKEPALAEEKDFTSVEFEDLEDSSN